jgi:hypothetical protein
MECGSPEHLECDHIVPVSKGGNSELSNLQTLCRKCNSGKSNRHSRPGVRSSHVPGTGTNGSGNANVSGWERGDPIPGMDERKRQDRTGQEKEEKERERRAARAGPPLSEKIPEDWMPGAEDVECARAAGIKDIAGNIEKFVDYYTAHPEPIADWNAAYRVWVRREFAPRGAGR